MREQKEYLVIYHKEDNDGVFSAAIFYDYIVRVLCKDITDICFIGADYNDLAKFAKENTVEDLHNDFKHIIMTDISFSDPNYMKKLWKEFKYDFIWCDHHAPIIKASFEKHFDDVPGIRDINRSAILCVYKYLYDQFDEAYNDHKVPELLRILSAWDSWTYEKEGYNFEFVRRINKAVTYKYNLELGKVKELVSDLIQTYQTGESFGIFSGLYKDDPLISKDLFNVGTIIANVEDQNMENIVKNDGDCTWNIVLHDEDKGRPLFRETCAIFMQGATSSTMFKSLRNTKIQNGLVFKHKTDGNWVLSLYNVNDDDWFHCGDFLKERYKGGGHKGAAGCTLTQEQFIKILKNKQL